ncbi:MAG: RNA-binding protein [Bacteriovoracaceae bacterium]|nr:RNA-binding protein [Bacteriovoracaceae bacterium]
MSKRLYVGNLPYTFRSEDVEALFREVGEVISAKVVIDRDTNRSKGFAFVEMASDELGARAIEKLNEKEVGGRPLRVTEANPRPERTPGTGHRFGGQREGGFSRTGPRNFRKD